MSRGRWKRSPQALAEEAFCVLIRGDKAQRRLPKPLLKQSLSHNEVLVPFLKLCMEFDDSQRLHSFRKGLLLVVQSIGTTKVAMMTKIHRVTLYRMLARNGNPSLGNLMQVLRAVGLRLWVLEPEFFLRRERVVRPKDVAVKRILKVSKGRRIWTRHSDDDDPDDKW